MRTVLMAAAATMAAFLGSMSANATPLAAGGSVSAAPVTTTNAGVVIFNNNIAFTSQAPAGQTSTFSGTYSEAVYKDSSNTLCASVGNCLSFAIRVANNAASRDGIETVTTGQFSSLFTYNVGYVAAAGGIAPLYISDSPYGAISFNFTSPGNTSNLIAPGQMSDYLIIQSSATNYAAGSISFQDNQTATVSGFVPAIGTIGAVPEPATWAMMILGMGAIGFSMRSAKRRSDEKFDAKIKRITEGALA